MSRPPLTDYKPHAVDRSLASHSEIRGCADKLRYPDKATAKAHREVAGRRRRPYRCDFCGGVHLASKKKRPTVDLDGWFRVGDVYATEDHWTVQPDPEAPPGVERWLVIGPGFLDTRPDFDAAVSRANLYREKRRA